MNFEALVNQHKDAIYRQMLRVCGNREDAEDVLIEALLNAYTSIDQLRDPTAFRAWLAQIARRVCWQLKEREALLPLLQLSDLAPNTYHLRDSADTPEQAAAAAQMRQLIRSAVTSLKPEFRDVYQLRDIEQVSGELVAARLGISLRAMKSRLHRARSAVREHMEAALAAPVPRTTT